VLFGEKRVLPLQQLLQASPVFLSPHIRDDSSRIFARAEIPLILLLAPIPFVSRVYLRHAHNFAMANVEGGGCNISARVRIQRWPSLHPWVCYKTALRQEKKSTWKFLASCRDYYCNTQSCRPSYENNLVYFASTYHHMRTLAFKRK
jgi:hypothetical protein